MATSLQAGGGTGGGVRAGEARLWRSRISRRWSNLSGGSLVGGFERTTALSVVVWEEETEENVE
jgi:hypothetical protein